MNLYLPNLSWVYTHASEETRVEGAAWYLRAYREAKRLADDFCVDTEVAAAVIAALSPASYWGRNVIDARRIFTEFESATVQGYAANKLLACRVVREQNPMLVKGLKTRPFWETIAHPLADNVPVIDRHMIHAAVGQVLPDKERRQYYQAKNIQQVQEAVLQLAAIEDVRPCEVQATIWLVWRNSH